MLRRETRRSGLAVPKRRLVLDDEARGNLEDLEVSAGPNAEECLAIGHFGGGPPSCFEFNNTESRGSAPAEQDNLIRPRHNRKSAKNIPG